MITLKFMEQKGYILVNLIIGIIKSTKQKTLKEKINK